MISIRLRKTRLLAVLLAFVLALSVGVTAVASTDGFGSINQFEMDVGPDVMGTLAEEVVNYQTTSFVKIEAVNVNYAGFDSEATLNNFYFDTSVVSNVDHNLYDVLLVGNDTKTKFKGFGTSWGGVTDRLIFPHI